MVSKTIDVGSIPTAPAYPRHLDTRCLFCLRARGTGAPGTFLLPRRCVPCHKDGETATRMCTLARVGRHTPKDARYTAIFGGGFRKGATTRPGRPGPGRPCVRKPPAGPPGRPAPVARNPSRLLLPPAPAKNAVYTRFSGLLQSGPEPKYTSLWQFPHPYGRVHILMAKGTSLFDFSAKKW